MLRKNNAVDFDDLLGLSVALLREDHELRQRVRRTFQCALLPLVAVPCVWSHAACCVSGDLRPSGTRPPLT